MNNLPKIGVPLLIILTFGLLVVAKSFVTIGSGEAGVLYKLFGGGVLPFPLFSFMSYNEIGLVVMQIHEKRKY